MADGQSNDNVARMTRIVSLDTERARGQQLQLNSALNDALRFTPAI
jgi:hypothetical protein